MNDIFKSILIGALISGLSIFLLNKLEGTSVFFIIMISFNFGLFAGLATYDIIYRARNSKGVSAKRNPKEAFLSGLTVALIYIASVLGVQASGNFLSDETFRLFLLVFSTGSVVFGLGNLYKYLPANK
jgi:hypothetical protein